MWSRALKDAKAYDSFQFVRQGYFCVDQKDSSEEHLVFNRIVSLKSSFRLPKISVKMQTGPVWDGLILSDNKSDGEKCAINELTINLQTGSKSLCMNRFIIMSKRDIQNGKLSSKEKLPSTRTLARHLEVSRSTIELAYEQLMSEGYIEAEPCRGYFVAQIEDLFAWRTGADPGRRNSCQGKRNLPV